MSYEMPAEDVVEGEPRARIAELVSGGDQRPAVGIFAVEPSVFDVVFAGEESIHVLRGSLTIDLPDGGQITLTTGDDARFIEGVRYRWTVTEPFADIYTTWPVNVVQIGVNT